MIDLSKVKDKYEKNKSIYKKTLDQVNIKKAIPILGDLADKAYRKHNCLELSLIHI